MVDWRRREQPDPFLDWKVRIFFAGAALLVAGMVLRRDVLALLAIVVLAAGLLLSMAGGIRRSRAQRPSPDDPESDAAFEADERT